MTSHEYKFTGDDKDVFSSLSSAMRFVGIVQLVAAFIVCAGALITLFDGRFNIYDVLIFCMYMGVFIAAGIQGLLTVRTASSIQKVVTSEDLDIMHLMLGMNVLSRLYNFQCALAIVIILGAGMFMLSL
jgi:hypothetical protein